MRKANHTFPQTVDSLFAGWREIFSRSDCVGARSEKKSRKQGNVVYEPPSSANEGTKGGRGDNREGTRVDFFGSATDITNLFKALSYWLSG